MAAGQSSAIYTMGAYTAGPDGSCAATNNTDIWRGYLVVTPVDHPADARLVRLRLNPNMTVDVDNQAGGATTVSISQAPQHLAAFGLWTVAVDTPAAPTPLSPPTVTGGPGHPGGDAGRGGVPLRRHRRHVPAGEPVRRPDGDPAADRAGLDRRDRPGPSLGTLVPATAPTIVPQGNRFELQVGPATFWWENPTGQPAYQHIRVAARFERAVSRRW